MSDLRVFSHNLQKKRVCRGKRCGAELRAAAGLFGNRVGLLQEVPRWDGSQATREMLVVKG